jgi:hypothetical protein
VGSNPTLSANYLILKDNFDFPLSPSGRLQRPAGGIATGSPSGRAADVSTSVSSSAIAASTTLDARSSVFPNKWAWIAMSDSAADANDVEPGRYQLADMVWRNAWRVTTGNLRLRTA